MKSRDTASAPPFPAEAASLLLPGAAGAIEIAVSVPAQDARNGVAVIAHPHPLQGGTMFNKVVTTLERAKSGGRNRIEHVELLPRLISLDEATRVLKVDMQGIEKLVAEGKLDPVNSGRFVRLERDAVLALAPET